MKCPRCRQNFDEGPPGLEWGCICSKPYPIPEPKAMKPDQVGGGGNCILPITHTGPCVNGPAPTKPNRVEMEAANEAMEKFRRADKQNDHLHPWVAYREGFVHGRSTMEAKLAASEARERVLREAHR